MATLVQQILETNSSESEKKYQLIKWAGYLTQQLSPGLKDSLFVVAQKKGI